MPDELVFMMGKYEARFPTDRQYAKNHLWLQPLAESTAEFRVGFTAYSVRLLLDVYFLDWNVTAGSAVQAKQEIGEIESSKALSTLYAPTAGTVLRFNENLLNDPSAINADSYGIGWLFDFQTNEELLTPSQYLEWLEAGWENTQRLLKGQINEQ